MKKPRYFKDIEFPIIYKKVDEQWYKFWTDSVSDRKWNISQYPDSNWRKPITEVEAFVEML